MPTPSDAGAWASGKGAEKRPSEVVRVTCRAELWAHSKHSVRLHFYCFYYMRNVGAEGQERVASSEGQRYKEEEE